MKKESGKNPEKKKVTKYSDANAAKLYEKIHSINDGVFEISVAALNKHSEIFTPGYGEKLTYLIATAGDVLNIRQTYLDYITSVGLIDYFNPVALLNALHLGLSHLQALIVVGKEQPNNMDLHRYIVRQLERLVGYTTMYNDSTGVEFVTCCYYSMQNITEH